MSVDFDQFRSLLETILGRFLAQNGRPAPELRDVDLLAQRLWALHRERAPIRQGEGELDSDAAARLTERVAADLTDPPLLLAARQLVKACLQPGPRTCRNSYRECTADGHCRRQDLARCRARLSGSHCVDCPYWLQLSPSAHAKLLTRHWHTPDAGEPAAHRAIFLPEDFRRLRQACVSSSQQ